MILDVDVICCRMAALVDRTGARPRHVGGDCGSRLCPGYPAPAARTIGGDAGLIIYAVKADKTADFENVMARSKRP